MSVHTMTRPADTNAMAAERAKWTREIVAAEVSLNEELTRAARLAADAVTCAHRIDKLRNRIEMRKENLAKYRP